MRIATVLYLNQHQAVFLNVAVFYALQQTRLRNELWTLRHPYSFRNIFPVYKRLNFDSIPEVQYRDKFRLPKTLCVKVRNYFLRFRGLAVVVRVYYGPQNLFYSFAIEELILLYLRRLALPDRVLDVSVEFGRCMSEVSQACNYMCDLLHGIASEFLDGRPTQWWSEATARYNAQLSNNMGVPLRNVCMYMDGTHERISNPWIAVVQALYYSGYIRHTSIKIVATICPQGLFVVVTKAAQGRRHDMAVALRANMYPKLRRKVRIGHFRGKVYGDKAFARRVPVYTPFNPADTQLKRRFNRRMSSVRISSEWGFKVVRGLWPSTKYVARQKILQGRRGNLPGKNLYNCIFLTNLHSCHQGGNLISDFFEGRPPTVEEYLGVPPNSLD